VRGSLNCCEPTALHLLIGFVEDFILSESRPFHHLFRRYSALKRTRPLLSYQNKKWHPPRRAYSYSTVIFVIPPPIQPIIPLLFIGVSRPKHLPLPSCTTSIPACDVKYGRVTYLISHPLPEAESFLLGSPN